MILLKFFGIIILFFFIFFLVLVLSLAFRFWGFIRQLLGMNRNDSQQGGQQQGQWYRGDNFSSSGSANANDTVSGKPKPRNSAISKDEGEYVDFEELS